MIYSGDKMVPTTSRLSSNVQFAGVSKLHLMYYLPVVFNWNVVHINVWLHLN